MRFLLLFLKSTVWTKLGPASYQFAVDNLGWLPQISQGQKEQDRAPMRGLPEETPALADLVAVIPKTICIRSPKSFLWLRDWLFHMRLKTELVVHERIPVDIWWQEKCLPQFPSPLGRTPVSKREAEVPSCCLIFSGTCISEHLGLLSLPEFFFVFALHISYIQLNPCWRCHVNSLLRCCLGTSISRSKYQLNGLEWSMG